MNRETAVGVVRIRRVQVVTVFSSLFRKQPRRECYKEASAAFETKVYIYRSFHSEALNIVMPVVLVKRR